MRRRRVTPQDRSRRDTRPRAQGDPAAHRHAISRQGYKEAFLLAMAAPSTARGRGIGRRNARGARPTRRSAYATKLHGKVTRSLARLDGVGHESRRNHDFSGNHNANPASAAPGNFPGIMIEPPGSGSGRWTRRAISRDAELRPYVEPGEPGAPNDLLAAPVKPYNANRRASVLDRRRNRALCVFCVRPTAPGVISRRCIPPAPATWR